jgi:hypothetical protein
LVSGDKLDMIRYNYYSLVAVRSTNLAVGTSILSNANALPIVDITS